MTNSFRRILSILLVAVLTLGCLTGCYKEPDPAPVDATQSTAAPEAAEATATPDLYAGGTTPIPAPEQPAFAEGGETVVMPEASAQPEVDELAGLTDTQRNSINMLNHLVVLTTEMNASRNNRLYLEETYSQVLNNFNPEMVDKGTQEELGFILSKLESYRLVTVKRERIQFLYEREQAQAIRAAIPSPLSLMNAIQSFNPTKLLVSVAYMAMDSITSYAAFNSSVELGFIQSNWDLKDEEEATLHESRSDMFDYMIEMVREYELPGLLSLNESAVDKFVEVTSNTNILQTIQYLESEQDTYKAYGGYWLALARCYYENGDYTKCLDAITAYEALDIRIFRKDYELAKAMPYAIVSAGEVLEGEEYVLMTEHYADIICQNTDSEDWVLRYFAAQTYVTLAGLTGNTDHYLEKAYNITLNNVNELVNEQKQLNTVFVAELVEEKAADGATNEQKEDVKAYNKMAKELRKTELAPISEPLYLNCELLFALADQLGKDQTARELINGILHEDGQPIFLVAPVDHLFYYTSEVPAMEEALEKVSFNGKELTLPLSLITSTGSIRVTVTTGEETIVIEDWQLQNVKRGEKEKFDTFSATYASETAKKHKYAVGATILIEVTPKADSAAAVLTFAYEAVADKTLGVFNSVSIEKVQE
ncbi:MAG: hypothetical protein IJ041_07935 [Clostridia bacterium]|nr:hypothetical protein [Clostridia bacterium]